MVIYSGFSHWKWWFSIAFCMFTRPGTGDQHGDQRIPHGWNTETPRCRIQQPPAEIGIHREGHHTWRPEPEPCGTLEGCGVFPNDFVEGGNDGKRMGKWWENDGEMIGKWWEEDGEMMGRGWGNDGKMMGKWLKKPSTWAWVCPRMVGFTRQYVGIFMGKAVINLIES